MPRAGAASKSGIRRNKRFPPEASCVHALPVLKEDGAHGKQLARNAKTVHKPPPPKFPRKLFAVKRHRKTDLPDVQNTPSSEVLGAAAPILEVGISNFRLPLKYMREKEEPVTLETSVTGTVSLRAEYRGINMSRLMRIFYEFKDRVFTIELLEDILLAYKEQLGSSRARLKLSFSYPMLQRSLRSGLEGWQYYGAAYEGLLDDLDRFRKRLHFDFVYSSTCPCSKELSDHAAGQRETPAIPHSQRSKARISAEVRPGAIITLENLQRLCRDALKTETQVMVRREDEQAFAELCGQQVKFVEDAVRLLYEKLDCDPRVWDFQVACAHLESLHSHDAVAVANKGMRRGFEGSLDDFQNLVC